MSSQNTIFAGQQGTYRHLTSRVAPLLADSGQTVARDLGVDPGDVRVIASAFTDRPVIDELNADLDRTVRAILDPGHVRAVLAGGCPGCGRLPGPGMVLVGWHPCQCSGHRTTFCRDDNGGCGTTVYDPPLRDDCRAPGFGFAPARHD